MLDSGLLFWPPCILARCCKDAIQKSVIAFVYGSAMQRNGDHSTFQCASGKIPVGLPEIPAET